MGCLYLCLFVVKFEFFFDNNCGVSFKGIILDFGFACFGVYVVLFLNFRFFAVIM